MRYAIIIHWDKEHTSPPIGPFDGLTAARKYATKCRKALRAKGRRRFWRVEITVMTEPRDAECWWGGEP